MATPSLKLNPRRPGRPSAAEKTVRILRSGVARLSPDLCLGHIWRMEFDIKKKKLHLYVVKKESVAVRTFRLWFSNDTAKSGLLSVGSLCKELDATPEKLAGVYRAVARGLTITIDMSEKLEG
jgi:hypothetical protein